ncbi:MAG: aminodeoxychorismate synthase component I [Desulfobacteraceae bacterium]|nr:aminodeoxychorismate synthase component I [Desulfobacteraceae bacterium]
MSSPYPDQTDILLESFAGGANSSSYRFSKCEAIIRADEPNQVSAALAKVEQAVARGRHAAGFISYEAASGLNPDLPVNGKTELPLVWFAVFAERIDCSRETNAATSGDCQVSAPEPTISARDYIGAVGDIRQAIARGETYQVNYTLRQRFRISGDPFVLYRRMCRNQQAPFCAWLDIGTHRILSASPELFFALNGERLTMRPMKGTAPRRPRADDDLRQRELLAASTKDRAENLMIVDLVRNDLARIAETGSVAVPALFDIETYPTVHQMTSTVTARIRPEAGLCDIFRALFPCGSVTGAPKRRTMQIIRELEGQPRGVYCGAIGYVSPGRDAVFSVAIRTVVMDTMTGEGEIGIGSGIIWDSDAAAELRECLDKSAFLTRDCEAFSLIESLRFDAQGYLLLERHLQRLSGSADYFGFRFDGDALRHRLGEFRHSLTGVHKVRVLLEPDGNITIASQPLIATDRAVHAAKIMIALQRVDSSDPFLYHKTSRRALYDEQLRAHPGCYDCIFLNERGELTEGSYNTIVISLKGELLTPALECGLLPGVLREELLEVGAMREAVLRLADLQAADTIWLVNSVRGWRECILNSPL